MTTTCNVNQPDQNGWTQLHHACFSMCESEVKHLLAEGADPNIKTPAGNTALEIAAMTKNLDIIKLIVEAGGLGDPLRYAVDLDYYCNVFEQTCPEVDIWKIVSADSPDVIKYLVELKLPLTTTTNDIMFSVVDNEWIETLKYLITIYPFDDPADPMLSYAISHVKTPMALKLLIDAGANVNRFTGKDSYFDCVIKELAINEVASMKNSTLSLTKEYLQMARILFEAGCVPSHMALMTYVGYLHAAQ